MTQPVLATGAGHNPIDQAGDRTMESVASTGRVDQARTYGQGLRDCTSKARRRDKTPGSFVACRNTWRRLRSRP